MGGKKPPTIGTVTFDLSKKTDIPSLKLT